jgi:hypothetical protein
MCAIAAMVSRNSLEAGEIVRVGIVGPDQPAEVRSCSAREILRRRNPDLIATCDQLTARQTELRTRIGATPGPVGREAAEELATIVEQLQKLKRQIRSLEADLISGARIVATTLSKAAITAQIYGRIFDFVVVDEAAMALIPAVAFAASLGRRVCLCGDHRQIGPLAISKTSRARKFLYVDVLKFNGIAQKVANGENPVGVFVLTRQHRMAPAIRHLVSSTFYGNLLVDGDGVQERTSPLTALSPFPGQSVAFCNIEGLLPQTAQEMVGQRRGSHFSVSSALISLELCSQAVASGLTSVAAISAYVAQASLLRAGIHDLGLEQTARAGTVHVFQGGEADAVIFDFCDSRPLTQPGLPLRGGLDTPGAKTLCTAFSRARAKLAMVGDFQFLRERSSADSALRRALNQIDAGGVRTFSPGDVPYGVPQGLPRISWFHDMAQAQPVLIQDVQRATNWVMIDVPWRQDLEWIGLQPLRNTIARVGIRAGDGLGLELRRFALEGANSQSPLGHECILIADGSIWRWVPASHGPGLIVRAQLPRMASLLLRLVGATSLLFASRPAREDARSALAAALGPTPSTPERLARIPVRDTFPTGRRALNLPLDPPIE